MAGKFDGHSIGNSLMSQFVKSRIKRKNVGWARPTKNLNGGPCPPYVTRGVLEQLESRILLSTFTVTGLADDGGANELRWAIQQANTAGGTNTINFKSGLTGTITLTKGELELSKGNATITGPGASLMTIDGNKTSIILGILPGVTASVSGFTITNGFVGNDSSLGDIDNLGALSIAGCVISGNVGGVGIDNGSLSTTDLAITNCTITGNANGGIRNIGGILTMTDSTVSGNSLIHTYGPQDGGIYGGSQFGNFVLNGCTISNNAGSGIDWGDTPNFGLTFNNCTVAGNHLSGVVFTGDSTSSPFMINNSFILNNGDTGVECDGGFSSNCTVTDCTISGNKGKGTGGGISTSGTLTIINSTISGNSADTSGGAIYSPFSGYVTVVGSTILKNTAIKYGGGIFNNGILALQNSTLYGNSAAKGGAVYAGALYDSSQHAFDRDGVVVTNCTIADNSATVGAGIYIAGGIPGIPLFYNTILWNNAADDFFGNASIFSGNNLIGNVDFAGGMANGVNGCIVGANPQLGPLQNNGGPTETMAIPLGSLAVDAGGNGLLPPGGLTTDQRGTGFARIYNGTVDIGAFEYQPSPPKLVYHTQPDTTSAGSLINPAVVVYVEDSTGNILSGDDSAVTLSLLTGSLNGTITVNAVNGIATFSSLLIYTAGTYTLHAADGTIPAINSNSFTVNPAAGAKLVFAAEPSNANAGANLTPPVVVYEMDAFGNIVRTDTSKVNLSVETGPGVISGTASVALNNGAAIFSSVSFNTGGTYTLIAQDGSLASVVSTSFQIAGTQAQYHLVFAAGPTNTAAGQVLNPSVVVYLMDSQNNIIRNDTSKVTLSVTSGPGTIAGTTSVAFNNGAAIFSNISFPTAGTYTITAKDGIFTSITSSSFTISPVTTQVAHLVFIQNPTNIIAGKNIAPNITVKATDASGKVVGGVVVTLEISSGPSGGALFGKWTSTTYATGIAAFGATTLHLAGTYTLTASIGGVVSSKSTTFTVSPAVANKPAFTTLPTSATHGTTFTVKVSVEDTYGNVLTTQNIGTITLALATHPTGSTLGGTLTANVVNGVATFSNLTASLAGSYSFKASDSLGSLQQHHTLSW